MQVENTNLFIGETIFIGKNFNIYSNTILVKNISLFCDLIVK